MYFVGLNCKQPLRPAKKRSSGCVFSCLQAVQNRAFRPLVAVAGIVPTLQLGAHRLKACDLRVERCNVFGGKALDLARVPPRVFLQAQQRGDLLQRKADLARVANEMQPRQIARTIAAITGITACGGREQPLFLIIADLAESPLCRAASLIFMMLDLYRG